MYHGHINTWIGLIPSPKVYTVSTACNLLLSNCFQWVKQIWESLTPSWNLISELLSIDNNNGQFHFQIKLHIFSQPLSGLINPSLTCFLTLTFDHQMNQFNLEWTFSIWRNSLQAFPRYGVHENGTYRRQPRQPKNITSPVTTITATEA